MKDLNKIAVEIRDILTKKREELELTFIEEDHKYFMKNKDGEIKSDFPSVSKVMKLFYDEFPTDEIAEKKSKGDPVVKQQLIEEWAAAGTYSTNMGSRVHYFLEQNTINLFGDYKEVRQPIFDCDFTQILKGDSMISAGKNYLKLMIERGAELLDTVAKKELDRGKVEYDGDLDTLFTQDIHKFAYYNMTDVDLVYEMDEKLQLLNLARSICHKGHVPYEDVYYASKYLDGAAIVDSDEGAWLVDIFLTESSEVFVCIIGISISRFEPKKVTFRFFM